MNKYVVYTAIFNNYDILKETTFKNSQIDFICFTDNLKLKSNYWKIIYYDNKNYNPTLYNRYLKILGPFSELKDYNYSLYIDGSIVIKKDIIELFELADGIEMMNFKHDSRNCLFSEIDQCIIENRGNIDDLTRQKLDYQKAGMPENFSLSANGILLRYHRSKRLKNLMEAWWNEVWTYSGRDQVSLPYVMWKNNFAYNFFNTSMLESDYFEVGPHRREYIRRLWRFFKKYLNRFGWGNKIETKYKAKLIKKLYKTRS
jgi:hypothetical protein